MTKERKQAMIGERLSDLRKDKGLTQQDLADILHLTKYNISAYEREANEAPDNVKIAMARYFDVSVDYLLGLTDRPNAYEKPGNRIPVNKKLPPEARDLIECLKRLVAFANAANPQYVYQEIQQMNHAIMLTAQGDLAANNLPAKDAAVPDSKAALRESPAQEENASPDNGPSADTGL